MLNSKFLNMAFKCTIGTGSLLIANKLITGQSYFNTVYCEEQKKPGVCPVNHGKSSGTCPVNHQAMSHGSGVFGKKTEPTNTSSDNYVKKTDNDYTVDYDVDLIEHADTPLGSPIPSTGRGNSDDGSAWVNPTASELFRALRRNNKIVNENEALDVALIHADVVGNTWNLIMEYESRYSNECNDITLESFEGKYGQETWKSWYTRVRYGIEPFDRHDWVINRCGTKVDYIIDYYAVPNELGLDDYIIDVRPDINRVQNIKDRLEVAYEKYKKGEEFW